MRSRSGNPPGRFATPATSAAGFVARSDLAAATHKSLNLPGGLIRCWWQPVSVHPICGPPMRQRSHQRLIVRMAACTSHPPICSAVCTARSKRRNRGDIAGDLCGRPSFLCTRPVAGRGCPVRRRCRQSHATVHGIRRFGTALVCLRSRSVFDKSLPEPKLFPARQTREASQAIARRHRSVHRRPCLFNKTPWRLMPACFTTM